MPQKQAIKTEESTISKKESKQLFGCVHYELVEDIVAQARGVLPCNMPTDDKDQILKSIFEMKPIDPVEARLYAQQASLYALVMEYFRRAERSMFSEGADMGSRMWYESIMSTAMKLLRLHNETVDVLNRYRRRGEQKVIVQHIHVEEGGKAIVNGSMDPTGGGGDNKRGEVVHG
jgi:hypothetical protein